MLWITFVNRLATAWPQILSDTECYKLRGCLHLHLPKADVEKTWDNSLLDSLSLAPKIRSASKYSLTAGLLILSSKTPRSRGTSEKLPGQKCQSTNDMKYGPCTYALVFCAAGTMLTTRKTNRGVHGLHCKLVHAQGFYEGVNSTLCIFTQSTMYAWVGLEPGGTRCLLHE